MSRTLALEFDGLESSECRSGMVIIFLVAYLGKEKMMKLLSSVF